jgi:hypothetical protein
MVDDDSRSNRANIKVPTLIDKIGLLNSQDLFMFY